MGGSLRARVEQLVQETERLRDENRRLRERIEELEGENRQLREQVEEAQRAAARQAAPFRRREAKRVPPERQKRPGRKRGHKGCYREPPREIDEVVEVRLGSCPHCGGPVGQRGRLEQIIEEIPLLRPRVVKVVTYRGWCPHCGAVRSRHPLQTSTAGGAAKVHLGPRAQALGVLLNKALGLTMGTTCRVLRDVVGLRLSRGGLSQLLARAARKVRGCYDDLVARLRSRPAVFADETSWWVGGPGWWLWVFTTPEETVYVVDRSRGSQVVADVLGDDFAGMLVSDCLSSYDPAPYRKHKCIAHHQQAIARARDAPGTTDPTYLDQWQAVFRAATVLHRTRADLAPADFAGLRENLQRRCDELLAHPCTQPGDVAVRKRLVKHRDHLLGCLHEPAAEPTNNRSERALRPAVITRKLSCGNRTESGRDTWQILATLAASCAQCGQGFLDFLAPRLSLVPAAR